MTSQKNEDILLEVLICTFGEDGIKRIAAGKHPRVNGVRYLVSWQTDKNHAIPDELVREDFIIFKSKTKGLAVNRNIALSNATAGLCLISDDDVDYYEDGLKSVIKAFDDNPMMDIVTFRYDCKSMKKPYPSGISDLRNPPKGYYVSSIELAFRRESVQGKIWFNENFGVGATFPSGEEDVFLKDCFNSRLNGIFMPISIARHDGTTTSDRNSRLQSRPMTKGAVFIHTHPDSWPLRMTAHALREIPLWRKGLVPSPFSFCHNWIRGVIKAKRSNVFPTPDYSNKYTYHD